MQVSLPQYQDRTFLQRAEQRYRAFLYLMKNRPGSFMVPTYDIDLMWHAHQVRPPGLTSFCQCSKLCCGVMKVVM